MEHNPPRIAKYLLRRFCHVTLLEEIEGDLDEQFCERVNTKNLYNARVFYLKETLHTILFSGRTHEQSTHMRGVSMLDAFKHFLKISFRNLKSNPTSSLINITGLALSLTSFLLIYLYLYDEMTYDTFHRDPENTYRISLAYKRDGDGVVEIDARAAGLWAVTLKDIMPEVKAVTRFSRFGYPGFVKDAKGDNIFVEQQFFWADANYTDIFNLAMIDGSDAAGILKDPQNLIINETIASKYFGKDNPTGRTLIYSRDGMDFSFIIGGVMKNYPSNAHFHPDFIANNVALNPFWKRDGDDRVNHWGDRFTYSFIQLNDGTDPAKATHVLTEMLRERMKERTIPSNPILTRLTDIHFTEGMLIELETSGDRLYLYIFGSIGILILVIASINYMNLATARSIKRAKEVGLRKTLGVKRGSLILQFLGESFLMIAIAFVFSIFVLIFILPAFNELAGKSFTIYSLKTSGIWISLAGVILVLAILSGSYPAFYLSRFKPSEVLKGNVVAHGGAETFRRMLVVFQFAITILLIISTAVIRNQMSLIQNTKLAQHDDQIMTIRLAGLVDRHKFDGFRQLAMKHPAVNQMAMSSHFPIQENFGWNDHPVVIPAFGKAEHIWDEFKCDGEFPLMFALELVAGRQFMIDNPADSSNYIINESAVKDLGITAEKAIGLEIESKVCCEGVNIAGTIIGVIKDFNYRTVRRQISPMMLNCNALQAETVNIKLDGHNYSDVIAYLEKSWKSVYASSPFEHWFMDDEFEKLYRGEIRMQKLSNYFSAFTIVIACLGLFGLASFTTEQKTKEIGIRKVLGASVGQILTLLTNRFVRLIVISYTIAIPAALFAMRSWLENFSYKVDLDWLTFSGAGLLILVLTYLTVGAVSAKAALQNPVDIMRHE
ncbi:MAG: FtsX-like permease family protein [Chryseolinea sp.]